MIFSELVRTSFSVLKANGRRTFLSMIGIIIGVASVIVIISLGNGFKSSTISSLSNDTAGRPSQTLYYMLEKNDDINHARFEPFTQRDRNGILSIDGVAELKADAFSGIRQVFMNVKIKDKTESKEIYPVEQSEVEIILGRNLTVVDQEQRQFNAVITDTLAEEVFGSTEAALDRSITIGNNDYTVVGISVEAPITIKMDASGLVSNTLTPQIYIPKSVYQLVSPESQWESAIDVFFDIGTDTAAVSQKVQQYLTEKGDQRNYGSYQIFDKTAELKQIESTLNMVTVFISAVAAISLFIAGVGIMNMMYISVAERTKEIGIRRALGATKRAIEWQFLLEGITITTLGGVIGYVTGMGLAFGISKFLPFNSSYDVTTALAAVFISIFIGIVFSVFPARSAAAKNVVDILRG